MPRLALAVILSLSLLPLLPDMPAAAVTITSSQDCVHGNGHIKTESRKLAAFDSLEVSGAFNVVVTAGSDQRQAEITADDNIVPLITTKIAGGKLIIRPEKPICTEKEIEVRIQVPSLIGLSSSGADTVKVEGVKVDRFSLELGGSSNVELQGSSATLEATISGAGDLKARDLKTRRTTLNISGTGNASVYATELLQVEIAGVAEVDYYGRPKKIEKQILGVGTLNPME